MEDKKSIHWGGKLMMIAGVLFLVVNSILSLLIDFDLPWTETMASDAFFNRLSVATLLMFLLTLGTYHVYRFLPTADRTVDRICFGMAFLGCSALFAHEWAQVFYLHPLAQAAPQGLQMLEDVEGFNLYDLEAVLAAGLYSIGWLAFAILLMVRNTYGRLAPGLIIAGFIAILPLSVTMPIPYGAATGSIPLAIGYFVLGQQLNKLSEETA